MAQVSRVPADSTATRFLLDDGNTGYALDGDNIIGVFSHPDAPGGAAQRVLQDAVARGGRRLDGFDTFLPKVYAQGGFRAVARLPFNPEYAPSVADGSAADWDADAMEAMGSGWGNPDVVFMVYDPDNANADTDNRIEDYDDGIAEQDRALEALARGAEPGRGPAGPADVPAGIPPVPAAGIEEWLGYNPGTNDRKIRAEIQYAVDSGRNTPNAAVAHLRHSPLFRYDRIMNDAAKRDGKDYGPAFFEAHSKFTRALGSKLAELSRDARPADTANYLDMAKAQKNDHIRKLIDGINRGTIEVSDVEPTTRLYRIEAPETQRVPIPAPAMGINLPEGMASLPSTSDALRGLSYAASNPVSTARTALEKVEDNFFNAMAPIRRLEIATRGKLGIGMESAFKAAETAVNDPGRNEALMYQGAAKLGQYGDYRVAEGTKGVRVIFDNVANAVPEKQRGQHMADWMGYMMGRRIMELRDRGFKAPFPMSDAEAARYAAMGDANPEFKQAADDWQAHNAANIDFLVDTGRITKAQADAMKETAAYVPFYRSEQNSDGTYDLDLESIKGGGRGSGNNLLSRDPGIKALKGGDRKAFDNLLQNMVRNSQAMVAAGQRNQAANKTFDLMQDAGLVKAVKGTPSKKPEKNAVAVWRNGKKKWIAPAKGVTEAEIVPLLVAMQGLQPLQLGRIQQLMADIGSIFRQGITLSPAFMLRNGIRGAVSTGLMTSGANLTGANNTLTGMREALSNSAAAQAFKASSGMGDYKFGGSDVGFGANDILIDYGLAPKSAGYRLRRLIDKAEAVGSATELADRIAAYNTMIERGVRADEAAYQARAIMDYSRRGANQTLRAWLPMVPFLNARLQGLSRLLEGAVPRDGSVVNRKAAMKQLALNGLVLTALSAALWARNAFDDERQEKYKNEPLWKRLNYHIVYLGDKTVLIPKAFELGHIFSSIPELFGDVMVNDMNEIGPGLKKIVLDTVAFNAIPAAVVPILEAKTNHSFFTGRPIEGRREESLRAADRSEYASSLSKFVGQQLGISDLTKVSPNMIEHVLQGYGGTYFLTVAGMMDVLAQETGVAPPPPQGAFGSIPLISPALQRTFGSMLRESEQDTNKYLEEFYRNREHITQIYRSAKAARENGRIEYAQRLLDEVPAIPAAYKLMNKAASQMGDLNSAIRDVKNDRTMSPKAKSAKLKTLIQKRNALSAKVTRVIDDLEEKQGRTFKRAA
jgi:hypothetical protein